MSMNVRYAAIHASYWSAYGAIWGFLALLLASFGFTSAQTGVISSCATLLAVFLSPALSSFLDVHRSIENRHALLVLLGSAAVLSMLVWLFGAHEGMLTGVCFVLIGTLISTAPPFQNAMAIDANRCGVPVVYGFCRGVGSISYALAVLVLGVLLERCAPRMLLPVFSALTVFGLIATARFRLPHADEEEQTAEKSRSTLAIMQEDHAFTLTLAGCMFFFAAHMFSNTYMNLIVGRVGGTAADIGRCLALAAVLELPAMTLVSRLHGMLSAALLLRVAAAGEVIKFLLYFFAPSMAVIYLAQLMQFFQFAVYLPATVYYVADTLPVRDQLKGQSLIHVAGSGLGAALGSFLGGVLIDWSGIQSALLFSALCTFASLTAFCVSSRAKH